MMPSVLCRAPVSPGPETGRSETDASSPAESNSAGGNAHIFLRKPRKFRRTPSGLVDCHHVLTRTFGKTEFKGKQKEIVEAAVLGADVFVVAPTGMGKSLCFQIPAVADEHGITIVVSPLLALMKDQVSTLQGLGVSAVAFTSETQPEEKAEILKDLSGGHPYNRLLYITPEKLMSPEFRGVLRRVHAQKELSRLVIDEAHCISEWGHDFRADYRKIGSFREQFKDVPIMALTASATPAVQADIIANLKLSPDHLFKVVHPFNRPNLFYEVRYLPSLPTPSDQYGLIYQYLSGLTQRRGGVPCAGLIYARTRQTCDELAGFLRGKGLMARPYHRGIPPAKLARTMAEWIEEDGGCDVIVGTICLGMGIDKSDVRYIIHFDIPKSFEGYYQETGRAGRNGEPAKCILYYSREDVVRVKKLVHHSHSTREKHYQVGGRAGPAPSQRAPDSLASFVQYCENTDICRHILICRYFGERIDAADAGLYCENMCDICKNPEKTKRAKAALSSQEFVMTQAPRLEREVNAADADEDLDGYPNPAYVLRDAEVLARRRIVAQPAASRPAFRTATNSISSVNQDRYQSTTKRFGEAAPTSTKPDGWWATDGGTGGLMVRSRPHDGDYSLDVDGFVEIGPVQAKRTRGGDIDDDEWSHSAMGLSNKKLKGGSTSLTTNLLNAAMPTRRTSTFKTPFKKPDLTVSASTVVKPQGSREKEIAEDVIEIDSDPEGRDGDRTVINGTGQSNRMQAPQRMPSATSLSDISPSSSPVKFESIIYEVDASMSQKIAGTLREETMSELRNYLHKALMIGMRGEDVWSRLGGMDMSQSERSDAVLECAKELEFLVMSYSVSNAGYQERKASRIAALKQIAKGNMPAFKADETVAPAARGGKGKGRVGGRVNGTAGYNASCEEMEEVVKILRTLIQRWNSRNTNSSKQKGARKGGGEGIPQSPEPPIDGELSEDE